MVENLQIKVMHVEDTGADVSIVECCLNKSDFLLINTKSLQETKSKLDSSFDIVLLDLGLPDSNGLATFLAIKEQTPEIPIIVLTGTNNYNLALEAISKGAQDFLVKGKFDPRQLETTIRYALLRHELENLRLEKERFKERENFIAMLTHNLNVPLIGMENVLKPLIEGACGPLSDEITNLMKLLLSTTRETRNHIKTILNAYHMNEATPASAMTMINLSALLERSIEEVKAAYPEKELQFVITAPAKIPELEGIEYSIYTLLLNLIDNAAKFGTPKEKIHIDLKVMENDLIGIAIENKGKSIPQDKQSKMFDYFYSTFARDSGTSIGVGLYLAKRIVENHHGKISLESGEEKTVVKTELPLDQRGGAIPSLFKGQYDDSQSP